MSSSATERNLALAPAQRRAARRATISRIAPHVVLIFFSALAVLPILLILINSFKDRGAIFGNPYALPLSGTLSLDGYTTVLVRSDFSRYFLNSLIVTLVSMLLILLTGAMASFALSEYHFRGSTLLGLYLALGIMIPIRLGTVSILYLIVGMGLTNTLWALVLVYTAQGLPLAIFILSQFMRQVPGELKDAARIDGASEYRIFWLILPLVRPALATVAVFIMIPIWNDLWFPLILAPSDRTRTVTLGAQQFLGQFISDWNAVLAALSLAIVPVLLLYVIFSKQLIRGLTAGTTK